MRKVNPRNVVRVIIQSIFIVVFISLSFLSAKGNEKNVIPLNLGEGEVMDEKSPLLEMRNELLTEPVKFLGGIQPFGKSRVYGVVIEMGTDIGAASLICLIDGTCSLYYERGGGTIGLAGIEKVKKLSIIAARESDRYTEFCKKTSEFPMPKDGEIFFYIITADGILTYKGIEADISDNKSKLSVLFFRGNDVLTAIRVNEAEKANEIIKAVMKKNRAVVEKMLSKGADPDLRDADDTPILALAASNNDADMVEILLKYKASPDMTFINKKKGIAGATALSFAAGQDNPKSIKLLVSAGADVDSADDTGLTPLMAAAGNGKVKALLELIVNKAQLEKKDNEGYTALVFAANAGRTEAVKELIKAGADVNTKDNQGSTPIMFAAQHGYIEPVKLLLENGADPYVKGTHGLSAMDFAEQNNIKSVIKLIKDFKMK
ncbi:MAG: hypothetical protein CVV21_03135 [Candidatus Goldiibacteriota bacterium HGW-Goldbacteria-1]|jgi:ankyrin repeat protein|nr:MAG: hypothetical protein CVV21_03135 [Candidatus Goldiibacteriota bacterium HGW-Goldbacteria-1]